MANRYWVGGDGTWNSSSAAHWSTSSGGASGASVPTSTDDVIFDNNSTSGFSNIIPTIATCNNFTSTVSGANELDFSGGGSGTISIYGSFVASTKTVFIGLAMTFKATSTGQTINPNGCILETGGFGNLITFDGVGGEWTFLSDWIDVIGVTSEQAGFKLLNGSLITNNKNITCGNFDSNNSNVRNLNLGNSVINCLSWDINTASNLTFSAGTSSITCWTENSFISSGTAQFKGGNLTYYDLTFKEATSNFGGRFTIYGNNYFHNFTVYENNPTLVKTVYFEAGKTQTITGTFTANGLSSAPTSSFTGTPLSGVSPLNVAFTDNSTFGHVIQLRSLTTGSASTISAAVANVSYCDVKDIITAGAAAPFNNSTGGIDRGNNTGWTFPATSPWLWDFKNDGSAISVIENPTHTYGTPGVYTVKLTVTNAAGSNSQTRTAYIEVINADLYLQTVHLVGAS